MSEHRALEQVKRRPFFEVKENGPNCRLTHLKLSFGESTKSMDLLYHFFQVSEAVADVCKEYLMFYCRWLVNRSSENDRRVTNSCIPCVYAYGVV